MSKTKEKEVMEI